MPIKEVQQTVKQHAVPQNIMQVEFKVIGELTMRQFFYCVITAVLAVGAFKSGLPSLVRVPIAGVIALAGVAIAFLPVQDRGLDQWVANFFAAIYSPTQRIWKKEVAPPAYFLYQSAAILKSEMMIVAPTASRRRLEQYLEHEELQEIKEDPLDILENIYIKKVKDFFSNEATPEAVIEIAPAPRYETLPKETPWVPPPQPIQEMTTPSVPVVPTVTVAPIVQTPPKAELIKPQKTQEQVKVPYETPKLQAITVGIQPKAVAKEQRKWSIPSSGAPDPITPDRLAGRRFTNLSKTQGEIVLPVRGERMLKTSDETITEDINEKAEKLMQLIERIKKEEIQRGKVKEITGYKTPQDNEHVTPQEKPINELTQDTISEIKGENEQLTKQIENLKNSISRGTMTEAEKSQVQEQIGKLQKEKFEADSKIATLSAQVADLELKLAKLGTEPPKVIVQKVIEQVKVPVIPVSSNDINPPQKVIQKASYAKVSPLTNVPNVINGVVKDTTGKLVEGAVAIIKDSREDTVRALKTNELGQFAITTPVSNGSYVVEISKEESGLKFDLVSLEANGTVLQPIEFIGKM